MFFFAPSGGTSGSGGRHKRIGRHGGSAERHGVSGGRHGVKAGSTAVEWSVSLP